MPGGGVSNCDFYHGSESPAAASKLPISHKRVVALFLAIVAPLLPWTLSTLYLASNLKPT